MANEGLTYQQTHRAVALEAGRLVRESFNLRLERSFTLTRPRSLVDLVAELTGSVDSEFNTFILNNNLTGSEILEIPAGRTVRYVV